MNRSNPSSPMQAFIGSLLQPNSETQISIANDNLRGHCPPPPQKCQQRRRRRSSSSNSRSDRPSNRWMSSSEVDVLSNTIRPPSPPSRRLGREKKQTPPPPTSCYCDCSASRWAEKCSSTNTSQQKQCRPPMRPKRDVEDERNAANTTDITKTMILLMTPTVTRHKTTPRSVDYSLAA